VLYRLAFRMKVTGVIERLRNSRTFFRIATVATILIPYLAHVYFTLSLSDWLVDDAGISYVYARNLAAGHGLVSQPGMTPVEGYSNFLWIILMVPFFLLDIFVPFITGKAISLALVALTFYFLHKSLYLLSEGNVVVSFTVLSCLALNASFTAWTCSGLENPLFVALLAGLFYQQIRYIDKKYSPFHVPLVAGSIVGAIAMTHPDGIAYAFVFPLTIALALLSKERSGIRSLLRALAMYSVSLVVVFGGFILFRYLYFGDLFPNTYYVKGGPSLRMLKPALTLQGEYLTKFQQISASVLGAPWWWLVPVVWISLLTLVVCRKRRWREYTILVGLSVATGYVYLIMPNDYMGEFRFATAFFPFFYCCLVLFGRFLVAGLPLRHGLRRVVAGVFLLSLLYQTAVIHLPRLKEFSETKVISFARIARDYGERFNKYADALQIPEATFLVPDIGGTLYYSKLRIYDLAGLCDKTIARTRGKDQQRFYDYVFDTLKPTFLHIHGYFTAVSKFDDDVRFRRDYIAIEEHIDQYVKQVYNVSRSSGDYVRRDVVAGQEMTLDSLRRGYLP
jgi:hypothetical protein